MIPIIPCGRVFHAIVSVIAVNIQFSSPNGVLRSVSLPGNLGNDRHWSHDYHVTHLLV